MYEVLDDANGAGSDEAPTGMTWDEWVLELNDWTGEVKTGR
jgi:hypothetical protein